MADPKLDDRAWAMFYRDGLTHVEIAEKIGCKPEDLFGIDAPITSVVDHSIGLIRSMQAGLIANDHLIQEQSKSIENLVEALNNVTGLKKAEAAKRRKNQPAQLQFGRNANYLKSAWIGLQFGIWNAPIALFSMVKPYVTGLIASAVMLPLCLIGWIVEQLVVLVLGLCGLLREKPQASS